MKLYFGLTALWREITFAFVVELGCIWYKIAAHPLNLPFALSSHIACNILTYACIILNIVRNQEWRLHKPSADYIMQRIYASEHLHKHTNLGNSVK